MYVGKLFTFTSEEYDETWSCVADNENDALGLLQTHIRFLDGFRNYNPIHSLLFEMHEQPLLIATKEDSKDIYEKVKTIRGF